MAGAHEAPGRRGAPGVPGTTRAAIQLPPLSPSAPVRTQVFPPGRPGGRRRAAAYGPRVEGPDPVDDAGERRIPRGGSPQESGVRRGQRPSVHRLHRCRGRRGPRASGAATTAPPGVNPGGARRRRRRSSIGGGVGHEVTQGTSPGEGIVQAGKGPLHPTDAGQRGTTTRRGGEEGGLRMPGTKSRLHIRSRVGGEALHQTPSYTLRPLLVGICVQNSSVPKTQLEYGSFTRGLLWRWPVHDIFPIVSGPPN